MLVVASSIVVDGSSGELSSSRGYVTGSSFFLDRKAASCLLYG